MTAELTGGFGLVFVFRDLDLGWPGISMQLALASCNCNRAVSHNQHWLCLNSPFSKMPMFPLSVLQMWPNGYLALRFVLCNSSWLFTWSQSKEDSLTRRQGGAEPNLISSTPIIVKANHSHRQYLLSATVSAAGVDWPPPGRLEGLWLEAFCFQVSFSISPWRELMEMFVFQGTWPGSWEKSDIRVGPTLGPMKNKCHYSPNKMVPLRSVHGQNPRPSRKTLIFMGTNAFWAQVTRSAVRRGLLQVLARRQLASLGQWTLLCSARPWAPSLFRVAIACLRMFHSWLAPVILSGRTPQDCVTGPRRAARTCVSQGRPIAGSCLAQEYRSQILFFLP